MNATEETSRSLIASRAAEWFVAHRGEALGMSDRAQFTAWLKASPEHVREYLAVAGFSREMAGAARDIDGDLEDMVQRAAETGADVVPLHVAAPVSNAPRRKYGLVAAAVAIGLVLAALWLLQNGERWGLAKSYRTAHAEQSTWRLPDGSVMRLNSDSRVAVRFSGTERQLEILRGQVHFQVTPDPGRQFRVVAGRAEVIALGTEFDVYRRSQDTLVTVVEGKVAVVGQGTSLDASRVELTAGQQARVDVESPAPRLSQANMRESTAWLQHEIVFEQRPLADVTSEFNRYSGVPIRIEDAQLATLRISGVFDAYDTDSFVAFLRRLDGVAVQMQPESIRVGRK